MKTIKKIMALLMCLILLTATVIENNMVLAADTVYYENDGNHYSYGNGGSTRMSSIIHDNVPHSAFCVDPEWYALPAGYYSYNESEYAGNIVKCAFLTCGISAANNNSIYESREIWGDWLGSYAYVHVLLAYAYACDLPSGNERAHHTFNLLKPGALLSQSEYDKMIAIYNSLKTYSQTEEMKAVCNYCKVYTINELGSAKTGHYQTFLWFESDVIETYLTLNKRSSKSDITDSNPSYTYDGIVYGIYKDKNLSELLFEMQIGKNGASKNTDLTPYHLYPGMKVYAKELKANSTYELDPTVYEIVLKEGSNTFTASDKPVEDCEIRIRKFEKGSGKELSGTGYNVYWLGSNLLYSISSEEEVNAVIEDKIPTKLNSEGNLASLSNVPFGTCIIEEVTAPTGYDTVGEWECSAKYSKSVGKYLICYFDSKTDKLIEAARYDYGPPTMKTYLMDLSDSDKEALSASAALLSDTVEICSLYKYMGTDMRLVGGLYYTDTEGNIQEYDFGNDTAPEVIFHVDSGDVTVTNTFTADTSFINGSIIAREILYDENGNEVIRHDDVLDGDQTVSTSPKEPEISTQITTVNSNNYAPADANAELTDAISIKNCDSFIGKCIKITGTLYDQTSGSYLTDSEGDLITSVITDSITATDYSNNLSFSFDGSALSGHTVSAFTEVVIYDDNNSLMYVHNADFSDPYETVYFPELITSASVIYPEEGDIGIILEDVVTYENLCPNTEYTVFGSLVYKDTGEIVANNAGETVCGETTFISSESGSGVVNVEFELENPELYAGRSLVVYEEIPGYAIHADITDEEQTVDIPSLSTMVRINEDLTVTDCITSTNLLAASTYEVYGEVYHVESGEKLLIDGEAVTASAVINTDETGIGVSEVDFDIDTDKLPAGSYVVTETVKQNGKIIIREDSLNNSRQTFKIEEKETPKPPATGDDTIVLALSALGGLAVTVFTLLFMGERKRNKQ
ncbi:MAG: VaFE repeat-containing surface-anchored protein [Lachnospiraceae bacterium]|nr:VaFE repeat-containing surface-anchored protein [Lachnospiraceae bacterium]